MAKFKKIVCVLVVVVLWATVAVGRSTDIGLEALWNRVFDSTNDAIKATVSGVVTPAAPFEITDTNTIYIDINADIEAAIAAATAGDTIVLAAGTYTITDDIDIAQAINVVGQGIGKTTISCTTATKNMFHVTADDVRIANLSISYAGNTGKCIYVDATATTVFSNVIIENVNIVQSGTGSLQGIHYHDAGGTLRDCYISSTGTGYVSTLWMQNDNTAEAVTTLKCYNVDSNASSSGNAARGIFVQDNSATQNATMCLYNCKGTASGGSSADLGVVTLGGNKAHIVAENCVFNGLDFDVNNAANSTVTLYDTTLVNNTTSGTITYGGTVVSSKTHADGVVTSTNFKKCAEVGTLTIWISDGTTAEGALTGVEGDICLNGGTGAGQMAYCDAAGTNWTDM